jgi:excinuclease UvrABC nuclease subunit
MDKPNISQIPTQTGCYLLKDQAQNIIYVGKAKNLRQRIKQHLKANQNEVSGIKQNRFLNFIHD